MDESAALHALAYADSLGCDFAEVFLEDRSIDEVRARNAVVTKVSSGRDVGAGVRVVHRGATGFAPTNDISPEGLTAAVNAAAVAAGIRMPTALAVDLPTLDRIDSGPAALLINAGQVMEIVEASHDAAVSTHPAVVDVTVTLLIGRRAVTIANTIGTRSASTDQTLRYVFQVTSQRNGRRETSTEAPGWTGEAAARPLDLLQIRHYAALAARRSAQLLDARPAPIGDSAVVFGPGAGGVLFHEACGHGLEADLVAKAASPYAGRLDAAVASPIVTLIDDPTLAGAWGSLDRDDEGEIAAPRTLIQDGVLVDYLDARHRGGTAAGGNARRQSYRHLPMPRMSNTYLARGASPPADIIADTPRGIYCAQLGGGSVNTVTGEFSFTAAEAYLIEAGQLTAPLGTFQLVGNGPTALAAIDAVADDFGLWPGICGKERQAVPVTAGQPTLRVRSMTIAGGSHG